MDTRNINPDDRLIVALDVNGKDEALKVVDELGDHVRFYKVGSQLHASSVSREVIAELEKRKKQVFLDLKLDDTPRTIEETVRILSTEGVRFFTLAGNGATAKAAQAGRGASHFPQFLQVTLLSSWDESDLRDMLPDGAPAVDFDAVVITKARKILQSGCDGVIASGTSVKKLRDALGNAFPEMVIVTPGIRPEGTATNDHKRTLTPYEAIIAGADYLVVGRPVLNAPDKVAMVKGIKAEIREALRLKQNGGSATARSAIESIPFGLAFSN